jgi:hypothetical protein
MGIPRGSRALPISGGREPVRLRADGVRLGRGREPPARRVAGLGRAQLQEPHHVAEDIAPIHHRQTRRLDIGLGVDVVARGEEPVRHLLQRAHQNFRQRPGGKRVVEQPDRAARLADAPQLAQRRQLLVVVEHAEDEGRDDRIEARIGKLGAHDIGLEELDRAAQPVGAAARLLQHAAAGVDPDHLGVLGIMRDISSGAHARIEDPSGQPFEHPRAQPPAPSIFVGRIEQVVERGDAIVGPVLHELLISEAGSLKSRSRAGAGPPQATDL